MNNTLSVLMLLLTCGRCGLADQAWATDKNSGTYRYAKLRPVEHDAVTLTGGFWSTIRTRSRDIGVPTLLGQFERNGHIENFRICAEQRNEKHRGGPNCNEFFYKHLEAMAWFAPESADVSRLFNDAAKTVLSAQQSDGYLNTFYENPLIKENGGKRFAEMNRFEFYDFSHFTQAAIADYRASGRRELLDAAIRFADLIVGQFADPMDLPYKLYRGRVNQKYEHPNHELALVELYRVTGNRKYLDFVTQTLTEYGYFGKEHFSEMWGHAVQENLLEAGAVDLYLETGDQRIWEVVSNLWGDMREHKMYITGGTGSSSHGEAYGKRYELPNASAYSETCAAIALTFWHHKMLLATGDAKYADEMDRTLYNNILAGYGLDGRSYFYQNPLDWDPDERQRGGRRFEWHGCPCCPPNLHRLFATLDQYIYTQDDSGVQINLYADSTLRHTFADGRTITMDVKTGYPFTGRQGRNRAPTESWSTSCRSVADGPLPLVADDVKKPTILDTSNTERVTVTFEGDLSAEGTVRFRIPAWCENPQLMIGGGAHAAGIERGFLVVDQPWKLGTKLELTLPMPVRVIQGSTKVTDQVDRIAIQRGPIVYCMEQPDNPRLDLDKIIFPNHPKFGLRLESDPLGVMMRLSVGARQVNPDGSEEDVEVKLIPYYAWANREPGRMMVWLPTKAEQLPKRLPETIASTAKVSASFQHEDFPNLSLKAVNDQAEPRNSADKSCKIFHWWPHKGTSEWVQLDFAKPTRVSGVEVYWLDDTGTGQCRIPRSWRLLCLAGAEWKPVDKASGYPTTKDRFVKTTFAPVETDSLRLETQLRPGYSAGILEWRVLNN